KRYPSGSALMDALEKALKYASRSSTRQKAPLPPTPAAALKISKVTIADRMEVFAREHNLPLPAQKSTRKPRRSGSRRLRVAILLAFIAVLATVGAYTQLRETVPEPLTSGKSVTLFYNENSFYLLNQSDAAIRVNALAFERVGSDKDRFDGRLWGQVHPS